MILKDAKIDAVLAEIAALNEENNFLRSKSSVASVQAQANVSSTSSSSSVEPDKSFVEEHSGCSALSLTSLEQQVLKYSGLRDQLYSK